jgi:heparan-sulfate lyase
MNINKVPLRFICVVAAGVLSFHGELTASYNLPEQGSQLLLEEFREGTLGDFTTISLAGDEIWIANNWLNDEFFAEINGIESASGNDDWLISPPLDFEHTIGETLTFDSMGLNGGPEVELLISTDYDGGADPLQANWLPLEASFSQDNWTLTSSGRVDLSMYNGEEVYIAWRYTSSDGANAKAMQITNIVVSGQPYLLGDDFKDGSLEPFQAARPSGHTTWLAGNYQNRFYYAWIEGLSFETEDAEAWLISPAMNLEDSANETVSFISLTEVANDKLTFFVSNDYDGNGDPSTANWVEPFVTMATEGDWLITPSGTVDLSEFTDDTIHLGWRYKAARGDTSWWQVSNIAVTGNPLIIHESFSSGDLGSFKALSSSGDQSWAPSNVNGSDFFVEINAQQELGFNTAWLISPVLDFRSTILETLEFTSRKTGTGSDLEVLASTDYDGGNDPATATWRSIEVALSEGLDESVHSGIIDLTAYIPDYYSEETYIAFRYKSSDTQAAAWKVSDIRISATEKQIEEEWVDPNAPNPDFSAEYDRAQAAIEVSAELHGFNTAWQDLVPDSKFNIENIIPLLDLDFPGMESVKAAVAANDMDAAGTALLDYYKFTKDYSKFPTTTAKQSEADDALIHFFRGNKDVHPPIFRGANIDWVKDAWENGGTISDNEWYFQFHRLTWWGPLSVAYAISKNEAYFLEWRYELVDYAQDNFPFISGSTPWFVRRGMENYSRTQQFTKVLPHFVGSNHFDLKTLQYYLYSLHYQAEYIRTVYSQDGNHLLGELSEVFRNGINFPEFKNSSDWIKDALTMLPERMEANVYPDGMNTELVFSYHGMYVSLFSSAWMLFNEYGYGDSLPDFFYPRLKKMAEIAAYHVFPDFSMVQYGDGWKNNDATWLFRRPVNDFAPNLPWLSFMKTRGTSGTPPDRLSAAFPMSGFYTFRSEWNSNAIFMPIKNAGGGQWHSQIDNGTFDLYAYGRNFMIDSGAYVYGSDEGQYIDLRNWFRSTKAHQTLTLDYQNINLVPKHVFWQDSERLTTLVFENQSYGNLLHRRTVLFVDNKYFLVYDEASGQAEGEVRAHFNLVPCEYVFNESEYTVKTQFASGANLTIKGFPQEDQLDMSMEEGWISYDYLVREERPAWSYKVNKSSTDEKVSFLTALVPYKRSREEPSDLLATVESNEQSRVITLTVDETTYEIFLNADAGDVDMTIYENSEVNQFSPFFNAHYSSDNQGWIQIDWLGWLHANIGSKWVYSDQLGWAYWVNPDTQGRYWVYLVETGDWAWLDERLYPSLYFPEIQG